MRNPRGSIGRTVWTKILPPNFHSASWTHNLCHQWDVVITPSSVFIQPDHKAVIHRSQWHISRNTTAWLFTLQCHVPCANPSLSKSFSPSLMLHWTVLSQASLSLDSSLQWLALLTLSLSSHSTALAGINNCDRQDGSKPTSASLFPEHCLLPSLCSVFITHTFFPLWSAVWFSLTTSVWLHQGGTKKGMLLMIYVVSQFLCLFCIKAKYGLLKAGQKGALLKTPKHNSLTTLSSWREQSLMPKCSSRRDIEIAYLSKSSNNVKLLMRS